MVKVSIQDDGTAEAGPLGSAVSWIDRLIAGAATIVATGALVALFLTMMAEVIVRYLTTQGLGWPAEMPNLLFPWLVMGGIVLAAQRGQHISVTAILAYLNQQVARALLLGTQVIVAATFTYLGWIGLAIVDITGSETYPISGISSRWAYLAVVTGFFGVALTAITTALRILLAKDPRAVRAHGPEEEP